MKQRKLMIVLLTLVCAAMIAFGSTLVFAADEEDWNIKSGSPTQSTDDYGTVFEGADFSIYNSQAKLWPDKFGVSYRINRNTAGTLDIIMAAKADVWYEDEEMSYFRLTLTYGETFAETGATDIAFYAGETLAAQYSTMLINWEDGHSYSTNDVYFGKSGDGWVINLNDEQHLITDEAAVAACNSELEGFDNSVGYLQFESSGQAKLTFVAARYGIPAAATDNPAGWTNGGVLDAPDWLVPSGNEVVGWTCDEGVSYTLKGDDYLVPLNGFDLTMRMAHGNSATTMMLMLCSDYDHDWYAGTYSVGFVLNWSSAMNDNQLKISLMVYTNQTESSHEEPIRMSETINNFNWFGSNNFRIYKSHGIWTISVNGETVFAETVSEEGKTVNDYIEEIYSYFPSGGGYLEAWGQVAGGETCIIEEMPLVTSNSLPVVNTIELRKYDEKTYAVGSKVEIDLKTLFTDSEGDTLTYYATKGSIQNGVWTYTNDIAETLMVTFQASGSAGSVSARITLNFTSEAGSGSAGQNASGCNGTASFHALWLALPVLAAAVFVVAIVRRHVKKEEKTDENK